MLRPGRGGGTAVTLTGVRASREDAARLYNLWVASRWKGVTLSISRTSAGQSSSRHPQRGASRALSSVGRRCCKHLEATLQDVRLEPEQMSPWGPPGAESADTEPEGLTHGAQRHPCHELEAAVPEAGTSLPRPSGPGLAVPQCTLPSCVLWGPPRPSSLSAVYRGAT